MSKPDYEIRAVCLMRMDDIMGPVCEFTWMNEQQKELEAFFTRKSLIQLFTVSMMANVPRSILFEETQFRHRIKFSTLMTVSDKKLVVSICPVVIECPLPPGSSARCFSLNNFADQFPICTVITSKKFGRAEELLGKIVPGKSYKRSDHLFISLSKINCYPGWFS